MKVNHNTEALLVPIRRSRGWGFRGEPVAGRIQLEPETGGLRTTAFTRFELPAGVRLTRNRRHFERVQGLAPGTVPV